MKLLIAALVFVIILSCVRSKNDYAIVDNIPAAHNLNQAGEMPDTLQYAAESLR